MSRKCILIVATQFPEWGHGVSARLAELGYDTAVAAGADSAWRALANGPFDAILVEAMDDLAETCLILRILRDRTRIPIIVLGPAQSAQDRISCYQAGADLYLVTPVDMAELVARLGGLLRRERINAELRRRFGASKPEDDRAWLPRR